MFLDKLNDANSLETTVRAGDLGQISNLMLGCGAIGFLIALLLGRLVNLDLNFTFWYIVGTYFCSTLLFDAKTLNF
jgi:hypothetical protein